MNKFIMLWNSGIFNVDCGENVFNEENIKSIFKNEFKLENFIVEDNEEDIVMSIEEGIEMMKEMGGMGERVILKNEELLEMGDDFVEVSIVEIISY